MPNTFLLKIVTPSNDVYNNQVEKIFLKNSNGNLEILANHADIITNIVPCIVEFTDDKGKNQKVFVSKGIASMSKNELIICSDSAEFSENIDLERAEKAKERAEKRLFSGNNYDEKRAELALMRANQRIKLKKL
ncbi:ATP synthase F1 subunit epsilon [Clostridium uliginosum]|uniref:ATP synthase epsilon chain n=1 Tax=Clostridium uliginosum TaxID=119641 RepID=A0A1I1I9L5_9CLOT|nr:ATP synthase F1 subunit epsilon [Clostridium uliginosum]SFC32854.1 F-type H+-transporting ATPase subunit epsilon [Clostridium uliginosum]